MRRQHRSSMVWVAACLMLAAAGAGCESLQRKFTRKPKGPKALPTPIISFADYSRTMTPIDRYRKHYMMFDYWNDALLQALRSRPLNPKRIKRASSEALTELDTMQQLVTSDVGARLAPAIKERASFDRQFQSDSISEHRVSSVVRQLETQTRQIRREWFWRDVQDALKPEPGPSAETAASPTAPAAAPDETATP